MACKYTYNGVEYSKEQLISKLSIENSNFNTLYNNLVNEITNTETGRKVLDRVKRDYQFKESVLPNRINYPSDLEHNLKFTTKEGDKYEITKKKYSYGEDFEVKLNGKEIINGSIKLDTIYNNNVNEIKLQNIQYYTLEEQQEEAIVELLGMMTADKLNNVKDGKLISLLKRLLKEIKAFVKDLLKQREIEVDKLPDNMTLGDIANILAYSNSKLILPGNEVIYTTPDNQQFKTYQEASNHISKLAKSVKDDDLDKLKLEEFIIDNLKVKDIPQKFQNLNDTFFEKTENGYLKSFFSYNNNPVLISNEEALSYYKIFKVISLRFIYRFIEKNKEYEQSKEIIEEWKKVNNIRYNPEEVYSRGQGFYHSVGAYSDHDLELILQNILEHFKDNNLAGGTYDVSAFTKPIDKTIRHIEKSGVLIEIFPESKDINWASNIDVFSGSTLDTHEKFFGSKFKKELAGVSESKYPSLRNIETIQPNLADIIDKLDHHHNELGITLTGKNFRFKINEAVLNTDTPRGLYWKVKKLVDANNKILDQKYGKLIKPSVNTTQEKKYAIEKYNNQTFDTKEQAERFLDDLKNGDFGYKYGKVYVTYKGIQPTQTNETLKESISDIENNKRNNYYIKEVKPKYYLFRDIINNLKIKLKNNNKLSIKEKSFLQKNVIPNIYTLSDTEIFDELDLIEFEKNDVYTNSETIKTLEEKKKVLSESLNTLQNQLLEIDKKVKNVKNFPSSFSFYSARSIYPSVLADSNGYNEFNIFLKSINFDFYKDVYNKINYTLSGYVPYGLEKQHIADYKALIPVYNNVVERLKKEIDSINLLLNDSIYSKNIILRSINENPTEQALVNTKIAALKEVAKKYPRSLIRSEVKSIFYNEGTLLQKVPSNINSQSNVLTPTSKLRDSEVFYTVPGLYQEGSIEEYSEYRDITQASELVGSEQDVKDFKSYLEKKDLDSKFDFNINCL